MKTDERTEALDNHEEIVEKTGTCQFCKQIKMVDIPKSWTQEDIDAYIVETCDCKEAVNYTKLKKREEHLDRSIETTFRESGGTFLPDEARDLLKEAARLIMTGDLEQIQAKFEGVTGTICEGKDGVIKVIGSRKIENGTEVQP